MKKFVFTLQTVYDLTTSTEKQQKMKIRQLEDEIIRLNKELEDMKEAYLSAKERCAEEMKQGLHSDKLAQYGIYFEDQINSMIAHKQKIVETEAEREKWMEARVETRRELKTLDKLREAQYEEYQAEQKREAEKEISDIVAFKASNK